MGCKDPTTVLESLSKLSAMNLSEPFRSCSISFQPASPTGMFLTHLLPPEEKVLKAHLSHASHPALPLM